MKRITVTMLAVALMLAACARDSGEVTSKPKASVSAADREACYESFRSASDAAEDYLYGPAPESRVLDAYLSTLELCPTGDLWDKAYQAIRPEKIWFVDYSRGSWLRIPILCAKADGTPPACRD